MPSKEKGRGFDASNPPGFGLEGVPRLERLKNILGEQSWSLEKQGFVVSAHDVAGPLARDVWEWSGIQA